MATRTAKRWIAQRRPATWTPLSASLPRSVGEEFAYAVVEAWPEVCFVDPTAIEEIPDGSGRCVIVERTGRVKILSKSAPSGTRPSVFLDIRDRTLTLRGHKEDGLLGIAFHPRFADPQSPQRGWFFLRYTSSQNEQRTNRLSRFVVPPGSDYADPESEVVLIEMPERSPIHKGGGIAFGADGFLYTTFGTDGKTFPHAHAQRIDHGLWSGLLRIDIDCQGGSVSHPPPRKPSVGSAAHYYIPNDNPFVGVPNALEEFYSIGLRNPWRFAVDPPTGRIWVADVGDRRREEVNLAFSGSNHQFDYREGTLLTSEFEPKAPSRPAEIIGVEAPPIFEYERDGINRCIIGGYVYRGKKLPELYGKYIYADQSGRIYAISLDDKNQFLSNDLIAVIRQPGLGVSSFGQDADGELFICWIREPTVENSLILRLVPAEQLPHEQLPAKLSETGIFANVEALQPNPALIPYEVNSPLWSDRAEKRRWIGLSSTEKVDGDLEGRWIFPAGTVFVKHFDLPIDPSTHRRLETRILVCDDHGGVYGAAYRWNDEKTDAEIVHFTETEEIEYKDQNGQSRTQTWTYPGRYDCLLCHNANAGWVLGFNARQLNRDTRADDEQPNQLVRFSQAGIFAFDCSASDAEATTKLASLDDQSASVEDRVRSYFDSNCSHCHRPGGWLGAWDGRYETPLEDQGIVNGQTWTHRASGRYASIVRPKDLKHSFLHFRLSSTEKFWRMPPIGRNVVHQEAVDLVTQWIQALPRSTDSENDRRSTLDDKNDLP